MLNQPNKKAKELLKKLLIWFLAAALLLAFIIIIIQGYRLRWDWTGLNAHVGPNVQQYQPGKTLWDWMSVLCIPLAIAFGSLWFTAQQGKIQDAENEDNQRETALQEYIDKISDLLLQHNLRGSILSIDRDLVIKKNWMSPNEEVRTIARVRTLTVLTRLDGIRKRSVLEFLYESGFIEKENPIISLYKANLTKAYLAIANLWFADLSDADLSGADLSSADLSGANLIHADLSFADLRGANLWFADLSGADLSYANLKGAKFIRADLSGANLICASFRPKQLAQAYTILGATLPDGSSIKSPGDPDSFASRLIALRKQHRLPLR